MYLQFYGLHEAPFNITADPDFFFASSKHREALTHLRYGVEQRKGILLLTGEVGAGKTTLCRKMLSDLSRNTKTAFILNSQFSELQLLQLIVRDFGIPGYFNTKDALVSALNDFLINESRRGNNVVVVIDEAQNLEVATLECIRLLSNLETAKHKLLQIVLVGQPELLALLKKPELRQLTQRIIVRFHVPPLSAVEITRYIDYRLRRASKIALPIVSFDGSAIEKIYELSRGTPRIVNILCDHALLAGYVEESYLITPAMIERSAKEVMCL